MLRAVDDERSVRRHGLGFVHLWPALVVGLFPVFQIPFAEDAYILPRVFLLLVACAVGVLLGSFVLKRMEVSLGSPLGLPAIAIAVAAVLAMAFSVSPWASAIGQYLRYESVVVRVGYVFLFFVTVWLLTGAGERDRRRVVSWFLVGCCVASIEAVWEWIGYQHGLLGGLARPDGNLGNAALLGVLDAMAVPVLLARMLGGAWRWAPVLVMVLAGLASSTSRSAWLGALLGGLVVAGLWVPRRQIRWAVAGAVLAVLAAAIVAGGWLANLNADPYSLRLTLWERVLPMIVDRPLFGWGEDTMGLVFGAYAHGFLPGVNFDRAHSQLLDLTVAQGLVGLMSGAWFWSAFAVGMLRIGRWRTEECGALLAGILAYWTWAAVNFDWVPATGPLWLLAGVCWSSAHQPDSRSAPSGRTPPIAMWAAALATLVGAVYFGILPVIADIAYHAGQPAQAVHLDPLQARYHRALGEQLVAGGRLSAGIAELRRAGDLGDDDAATWVELGDAERSLGNAQAARAAYSRARAIDPAIATP
jgi:O-Antigen ligase